MTPTALLRTLALGTALWAGLAAPGAAQATRGLSLAFPQSDRIAIVVGNQDYEAIGDLANARRDAEDMAGLLRGYGFTVYDRYDVDRRGFETLLRTVMLNVPPEAEIVFYYAGHGIQIGRRNYLLPTDVAFDDIYDLPVETMTLDRVIDALSARGATHIAIIDACRENPFPDVKLVGELGAELFETKSGFDVFRTPLNSLVAFSTSPGELALDGDDGGNSPYTDAILEHVSRDPDRNITGLFSDIRETVYRTTGGRQVPWESSTLVRAFQFLPDDAVTLAQADATTPPPVGSDAPRAAGTPADLPATRSLTLPFDRTVPLDAALAQALGRDPGALRPASQPEAGSLGPDADGTLVFQPRLEEIRTTGKDSYSRDAHFAVEIDTAAGTKQRIAVDLTLRADPCDVQAGDAVDLDGTGLYRLANELDVDAALAACTAAVARAPDTGRFHHQLGRAQQAAGRFTDALASFETAADLGHTRALHNAGYLYGTARINRDIVDIPLDREKSTALFERGIAAGDPFAMNALGIRLLREGDTAAQRQRGFELLERAVELGHTYSMNELGIYFLTPDSDHYQPERGMSFLTASFERDDIYGFANMGFVALNGLDGNPPDLARAYGMFDKAAEGGHPTAPAMMGRMIVRGQAPTDDRAEAVRLYDMGLARGDAWGGVNAAFLIRAGDVPGLGPADAALRAAKATHLPGDEAAAAAREILDSLPAAALDRALQMALRDLGRDIAVDGIVGPGTLRALDAVRDRYGLTGATTTPRARLDLATRAHWASNPARPDLF